MRIASMLSRIWGMRMRRFCCSALWARSSGLTPAPTPQPSPVIEQPAPQRAPVVEDQEHEPPRTYAAPHIGPAPERPRSRLARWFSGR